LRCGEDFTKLKSHLKKKIQCTSIYLDISCDEMFKNYDKLFIEYKIKLLNSLHLCGCGKKFKYRSGLSRHKKICNIKSNNIEQNNIEQNNIEQNNIEQNNIEQNNIEQNNIEQNNIELNNIEQNNISTLKKYNHDDIMVNIVLQNFGNEVIPNIISILNRINKFINKHNQIGGDELFSILFKAIYIDTEENRSLIIRSVKDGYINIRDNNDWIIKSRKNMKECIINNMIEKINIFFNITFEICKNTDLHQILTISKQCYDAYMKFDYNKDELYSNFISILISNKKLLNEYKKKIRKTNIIEFTKNEKIDYYDNTIYKFKCYDSNYQKIF